MTELDLACRGVLIVVLATAGVAKLAARAPLARLARAIAGLGLPARLARRPVAAAVIAGELCCAALLLGAPGPGYAGALALIAAFTAALAGALLRDRRAICACFGAARPTPVLPDHLVRNAILLATAATGALTRWLAPTPVPAGGPRMVASVLAGVIGGVAITRWDDLALRLASARKARAGDSPEARRGPDGRLLP